MNTYPPYSRIIAKVVCILLFFFASKITFAQTIVLNILPSQHALNVETFTAIQVTFSQPMRVSSFNGSSFIVYGISSGKHDGTFLFNTQKNVVTFAPEKPFMKGEIVRVNATSKLKDAVNNSIQPFTSQFTTVTARSAGLFEPPVVYPTTIRPWPVFINDIDRDGDGDIVAVHGHTSFQEPDFGVIVRRNNGDGTFAAPEGYLPESFCNFFHMADLNGDDFDDIALTRGGIVNILINKKDGTFRPPDVYFSDPYFATELFAFDIDGDGDNDLIIGNSNNNIAVFKNNGQGRFETPVYYPAAGGGPWGVFVSDMDGDGDGDVVTANVLSSTVSVFLNNGNGTFQPRTDYNVGPLPRQVFVSDFDGDGDGDVVTTNQSSLTISVLFNNGNGTLSSRQDYITAGQPVGVFVSDIDGDGDQDILVANHFGGGSNKVSVFKNNGNGTFAGKQDFLAGTQPIGLFVSDIDNDGDGDIAVSNWTGNAVSILKNSQPGISGIVFDDRNGNGIFDTDEFGISNWLVQLQGGTQTLYSTTDATGRYFFFPAPGTYTVSQFLKPNFTLTAPSSGTYTVTLSAGQEIPGLNFGVQAFPSFAPDLCVGITGTLSPGNPPPACDPATVAYCTDCCINGNCPVPNTVDCTPIHFPCSNCVQKTYLVTYENCGSAHEDPCTLTVMLPPGVQYLSNTGCPPDNISGTISTGITLTWTHLCDPPGSTTCTSILPANSCEPIGGGEISIETEIACCTAIGSPLSATSCLTPDDAGCPNCDNDDETYPGPVDPNNKLLVKPEGCGPLHVVSKNDALTYQINFQNIGNAPAHDVIIIDTLDASVLDIPSVESIHTSHPATFSISGPGILKWEFRNINLPDSSSDPAGSVGFAVFTVRPRQDAADGAVIENRAAIFFDFNPPVITNTTMNTIGNGPVADFESQRSGECSFISYDFTYTGGTQGAAFFWDFGPDASPSSSTQENPSGVLFSGSGLKLVTLTVTLGDTCSSSASEFIETVSSICGNDSSKIVVCHRQAGSNPQELCISPDALSAHLAHGDCIGPCQNSSNRAGNFSGEENSNTTTSDVLLNAHPNPSSGLTTIEFSAPIDGKVKLEVYNALGVCISVLYEGIIEEEKYYSINFKTSTLSQGLYFYSLQTSIGRKVQKLIIVK